VTGASSSKAPVDYVRYNLEPLRFQVSVDALANIIWGATGASKIHDLKSSLHPECRLNRECRGCRK
jgi:hypothetical protein